MARRASSRLPPPLFLPFFFFIIIYLIFSVSSIFNNVHSPALVPRLLPRQHNPRLPHGTGGCILQLFAMEEPHGHGRDGASFTSNFSFQIITEPNTSCSTCMMPYPFGIPPFGGGGSGFILSSNNLFSGAIPRQLVLGRLTGLEFMILVSLDSGRALAAVVRVPYEQRTRKLLPGTTHGQSVTERAAKKLQHQHDVTHDRGKVAPPSSSWLELVAIAASALVGLICAITGFVLCCIRSKRTRQSTSAIITEPELRRGLGPRQFRYGELAAATCNFAEEKKIGRGGFGQVYRGHLSDQDLHVAIKTLSVSVSEEQPSQGFKEFQAEITVLSQLRHRNIVQLVGWWCGRPRRRRGRRLALVYELMPGGSLDTHLYNPDKHLTWPERYYPVLLHLIQT